MGGLLKPIAEGLDREEIVENKMDDWLNICNNGAEQGIGQTPQEVNANAVKYRIHVEGKFRISTAITLGVPTVFSVAHQAQAVGEASLSCTTPGAATYVQFMGGFGRITQAH